MSQPDPARAYLLGQTRGDAMPAVTTDAGQAHAEQVAALSLGIDALGVITTDPFTRAHLKKGDPQALAQAEQAFDALRALRSTLTASAPQSGVQSPDLSSPMGRVKALSEANRLFTLARQTTEQAEALMQAAIRATEQALREQRLPRDGR